MGIKIGDFFAGVFAVLFVGAVILGMLWASGFLGMFGGPSGISTGEIDDNAPPARQVVEPEPVAPNPDPGNWTCNWSPTMNEDWHDDVLCSRGLETIRPTLLPDWSYVTQDDMMRAASEYQASLNG